MNRKSPYVILSVLYAVCVTAANLIFQKFLAFPIAGAHSAISAGLLIYPFTFLFMSIIAEIDGSKCADLTIKISFAAVLLVILIIYVADSIPAAPWSPVSNSEFHQVFGAIGWAFFSSLAASIVVHFMDVRIFLWLKKLSNDKYLWLRSLVSTAVSQLLDTIFVIIILCLTAIIEWQNYNQLLAGSVAYKLIFALVDVPLCYLGVWLVRRRIARVL